MNQNSKTFGNTRRIERAARELERDEADEPVDIEDDGDVALDAGPPADRHVQEQEQLELVEQLVERLVVGDATEVQQVDQQQVEQVDRDRQERSGKRPAQDGQGPEDAERRDHEHLERHGISIRRPKIRAA